DVAGVVARVQPAVGSEREVVAAVHGVAGGQRGGRGNHLAAAGDRIPAHDPLVADVADVEPGAGRVPREPPRLRQQLAATVRFRGGGGAVRQVPDADPVG